MHRKGTILADDQKRISALFYQSESGKQPVRDWPMKLDVADRKTIADIKTVEFGWLIGMLACRALFPSLDRQASVKCFRPPGRTLFALALRDTVWQFLLEFCSSKKQRKFLASQCPLFD